MLLFTPGPHGDDILLADAVVKGMCATLVIDNKGPSFSPLELSLRLWCLSMK